MKHSKLIALAIAGSLALGALGLSGCSGGGSTSGSDGAENGGTINVAGSDTMVNLAQAWAEAYQEANPEVSITVKGGGSGNGIAALINKTIDVADASRPIKDEEVAQAKAAGVEPVSTEVARDGLVIIVNTANTVPGLTKEQLARIYAGEIVNWKDVGGPDKAIVLLGRDSSSGTYGFVKDELLLKLPNKPDYAKSMRNLQSTQAIVDEVAKNADAVGYIGLGYENASIKPVAIDGTQSSLDTVLDGSYALSRALEMISDGEPEGVTRAYLDWVLSAEGQAIVKEQGFVPLAK